MQQLALALPTETPHEEGARRFHEANRHVYRMFCRFTGELVDAQIANGRRVKVGAKLIFERMRWETLIETTQTYGGKRRKLNNNYTAYYARMFHRDFPEIGPVFELRETKK